MLVKLKLEQHNVFFIKIIKVKLQIDFFFFILHSKNLGFDFIFVFNYLNLNNSPFFSVIPKNVIKKNEFLYFLEIYTKKFPYEKNNSTGKQKNRFYL